MGLAVEPQRLLERLGQRPRVRDLLEQLHPLLVLDAVGLHLGDGLPALLERLRHQHRRRVVEDRLDHGEHVERVGLGLGVDQVERGLREGGQRLVEREVGLKHGRQPERPAVLVGLGQRLEHARGEQLLAQRPGLLGEARAAALVLVVVLHQRAQRRDRDPPAG